MRRSIALLMAGALLFITSTAAPAMMATNLELITLATDSALREALARVPVASAPEGFDEPLRVASQQTHDADWLVEQLLIEQLLAAGVPVTTSAEGAPPSGPKLEYRVVDLEVTGRSRILSGAVDRTCRVTVALRFSQGGELVSLGEGKVEITDVIPGRYLEALQHSEHKFADTDVQKASWERFAEPVIVTTVLGSLIYLFFSNR